MAQNGEIYCPQQDNYKKREEIIRWQVFTTTYQNNYSTGFCNSACYGRDKRKSWKTPEDEPQSLRAESSLLGYAGFDGGISGILLLCYNWQWMEIDDVSRSSVFNSLKPASSHSLETNENYQHVTMFLCTVLIQGLHAANVFMSKPLVLFSRPDLGLQHYGSCEWERPCDESGEYLRHNTAAQEWPASAMICAQHGINWLKD